jgi:hypothetical protein
LLISFSPNSYSVQVARFVLLLAVVAFSGCLESKKSWEITHPVSGTVLFKGKPVSEAELSFFPEDASYPDSVRPRAKTDKDGKFEAWTYVQGDGAPVGNYKVVIVHNEVAVSKDTIVAKPNDLPVKYSARDSTDLKAQVSAGKNELKPFDLK